MSLTRILCHRFNIGHAPVYIIESIAFTLLSFLIQGLGAYVFSKSDFRYLIVFFSVVTFSRSLSSAFILEIILILKNDHLNRLFFWFFGIILILPIALIYLILLDKNLFNNIFYIIVLSSFIVMDTSFQFFKRSSIIDGKMFALLKCELAMILLFTFLFLLIGGSIRLYMISFLGCYTTGVFLMGAVYWDDIRHMFHTFTFFNITIVKRYFKVMFSISPFAFLVNLSHFALGNLYIWWFDKSNQSDMLSFSKAVLLFYAPIFILASGITNSFLGHKKLSISHILFFFPFLSLSCFSMFFIFRFFGPKEYVLLLGTDGFSVLIVSIVLYIIMNSFSSLTISQLRKFGKQKSILLFILIGVLASTLISGLLLWKYGFNNANPFIFSAIVYTVLAFCVGISSYRKKIKH